MVVRADDLERQLGERLRELRLRQGLRQVDLARLANVSEGTVKNLEAGQGTTLRSFTRVCVALGTTGWVDTLAPPAPPISPLAALRAQQQKPVRRAPGRSRVRAARTRRHEL